MTVNGGSSLAAEGRRRAASLIVRERLRAQAPAPDLLYLFAPLEHARLDYPVRSGSCPVLAGGVCARSSRRAPRAPALVRLERMRANVVEAAEQCGILLLASRACSSLDSPTRALPRQRGLEAGRLLVFCDEEAPVVDPVAALRAAREASGNRNGQRPLRRGRGKVEVREEDDELLRAAEELGIDLSSGLAARSRAAAERRRRPRS